MCNRIIPYNLKIIFEVEIFHRFHMAAKFSHTKIQAATAICGWKLDHKNFIHEFVFEQNSAKL